MKQFELSSKLTKLVNDLSIVKGTYVAFALVDDMKMDSPLLYELHQRLSAKLVIQEVALTSKSSRSFGLFSLIEKREMSKRDRSAYFVYGFERMTDKSRQVFMKKLDANREAIGHLRVPIILWLSEAVMKEMTRLAPEFLSWRSTIFDFRVPAELSVWVALELTKVRKQLSALETNVKTIETQTASQTTQLSEQIDQEVKWQQERIKHLFDLYEAYISGKGLVWTKWQTIFTIVGSLIALLALSQLCISIFEVIYMLTQ